MQFLFRKKGRNNRLEIYQPKENEPNFSVVDSHDLFALYKYPENDFRYQFIQEYIKEIESSYYIKIFNCKFGHPRPDSDCLNFYIYLWEDDPTIQIRIENPNHFYVTTFHKILNKNPLPYVHKDLPIQFFPRNIWRIMYCRALDLTWHEIYKSLQENFPEIVASKFWYTFIYLLKVKSSTIYSKHPRLKEIKTYCFNCAKKHDVHNILD